MDSRRPKGVHDPIVRQVGFVTPGSEPQQPVGLQQVVDSVSPTPVIIPPPQPSSRSASDSSRHSLPVSVPAPSHRPATIPETDEPEESPQATASAMTSSPASASNKGYNSISTDSLLGTSPVPSLAPIAAAATGKAGGLPAGGAEKPFRAAPSGAGPALTLEPAPGGPLPSGNAPLSPRPPLVPASAPPGTSGLAPAELPRVNTRPPLQGPAVRSPIRSPASSGPATPTSQGGGGRGTQAAPSVVGSVPGGAEAKGGGIKGKTTKAERRAQQEAQRAAKAAAKEAGDKPNPKNTLDFGRIPSSPTSPAASTGADGGGSWKPIRRAVAIKQIAVSPPGAPKGGGPAGPGPKDQQKGQAKAGANQAPRKDSGAEKKTAAQAQAPQPGGGGAEKDKKGGGAGGPLEKKKDMPGPQMQFDDEQKVARAKRKSIVEQTETKNRVELFRHLPQFVHGTQLPSLEAKFFSQEATHPHPAVYQVGLQYLTGDIIGGNARTVAMLTALREMIQDYATPPEKTLVRDLTAKINSQISFLITCRPLGIGMGNAIRVLKQRIAKLPVGMPEAEAKGALLSEIDRFVQEKIVLADQEIVRHAVQKIRAEGDVLLTYGCSHVVELILKRAHDLGRRFRVMVVDSRPKLEGKEMLRRLLRAGIDCTYVRLNAVSYIMQEVTRVLLGAGAIMANGFVRSRVGSAAVAMVAHAYQVPVLVCCETYKFHERVQLDSITSNELGDPDQLVSVAGREDKTALGGWADEDHLQLLNLLYDAMPGEYVTMIVTELGMVPPTSVPVILREYRKDPVLL